MTNQAPLHAFVRMLEDRAQEVEGQERVAVTLDTQEALKVTELESPEALRVIYRKVLTLSASNNNRYSSGVNAVESVSENVQTGKVRVVFYKTILRHAIKQLHAKQTDSEVSAR